MAMGLQGSKDEFMIEFLPSLCLWFDGGMRQHKKYYSSIESSVPIYFIAFAYVQGTALGVVQDRKMRVVLFSRSRQLSDGVKTCLYYEVECGSAIKKIRTKHYGSLRVGGKMMEGFMSRGDI